MFLTKRPSAAEIDKFLEKSNSLDLSYRPVGLVNICPASFDLDEATTTIGRGPEAFARAKTALLHWRHFELGWVELFPPDAAIEIGTTVAVLIQHLGFWSLNGGRVVLALGDQDGQRFGFAYGTLMNHAETGEESFEVSISPQSEEVRYQIRAASRPRATLARVGYPLVRMLQARFRRDSMAAMHRAIAAP